MWGIKATLTTEEILVDTLVVVVWVSSVATLGAAHRGMRIPLEVARLVVAHVVLLALILNILVWALLLLLLMLVGHWISVPVLCPVEGWGKASSRSGSSVNNHVLPIYLILGVLLLVIAWL